MKKKIETERVTRGSSRSRRHDEDDENENVVETDDKHYRRRYWSHSSFTEIDYERESNEEDRDRECSKPRHHSLHSQNKDVGHVDEVKKVKDHKQSRKKHSWYRSHYSFTEIDYERESNEEDRDHECSKPRHHSRHSQNEDVGHVDEVKKVKDHKQSRKKHRSQLSSRKRLRSSKKRSDEENESDRDGRDHRHSRKKHRSQHPSVSGHGRDNHRHRSRHSSGDKKSRNTSSMIALQMMLRIILAWIKVKEIYDERDELEEGEISSTVSEGSRGIASGHVSRETSVNALISRERANSQPPETTSEVPDDLRAKIRAMLMTTRL